MHIPSCTENISQFGIEHRGELRFGNYTKMISEWNSTRLVKIPRTTPSTLRIRAHNEFACKGSYPLRQRWPQRLALAFSALLRSTRTRVARAQPQGRRRTLFPLPRVWYWDRTLPHRQNTRTSTRTREGESSQTPRSSSSSSKPSSTKF